MYIVRSFVIEYSWCIVAHSQFFSRTATTLLIVWYGRASVHTPKRAFCFLRWFHLPRSSGCHICSAHWENVSYTYTKLALVTVARVCVSYSGAQVSLQCSTNLFFEIKPVGVDIPLRFNLWGKVLIINWYRIVHCSKVRPGSCSSVERFDVWVTWHTNPVMQRRNFIGQRPLYYYYQCSKEYFLPVINISLMSNWSVAFSAKELWDEL